MTKILGGIVTVLGLAVLALALLVIRGPKPEARGDEAPVVLKAAEEAKVLPRGGKAGGEQKADTSASDQAATGIEKLLEAGDPDQVTRKVSFRRARVVGSKKNVILLEARGDPMTYVAYDRKVFPADFKYGQIYSVLGKVSQYRGEDQFQISKFEK